MAIHVASLRQFRPDERSERVDRQTALGNPFVVGRDGARDVVIRKFCRWSAGELRSNPRGKFARAFFALEARVHERELAEMDTFLLCWCAPEPCHADVLRGMLVRWRREHRHT